MLFSSRHQLATSINADIRAYWDERIHDTKLDGSPRGSAEFFAAMDKYRYERLDYLPQLIGFDQWQNRDVLDIGCGSGLDLVRFARNGANAYGVELSAEALRLTREYLGVDGQRAFVVQADGAHLPFRDESFDLVFCHGVLPFASDPTGIVRDACRVLRAGGLGIFMVFNRRSWMAALRTLARARLGHEDAPGFRTHTRAEFEAMLAPFQESRISTERLPKPTRLHTGIKRVVFDWFIARPLGLAPSFLLRHIGWHLVAECRKMSAVTVEHALVSGGVR